MTVKERILALQLIEMIKKDPDYAKAIGVDAKMVAKGETKND